MPAPPCPAACPWSACILWMHWAFVSKFAPANLQLQGSAITLETKAPFYTLYSSSLFGYPIVLLLKFLSFALSSKPPFARDYFLFLRFSLCYKKLVEVFVSGIVPAHILYGHTWWLDSKECLSSYWVIIEERSNGVNVFFVCSLIVCFVLSIFSFWSFPLFILLPFYTRISDWQWKRKV